MPQIAKINILYDITNATPREFYNKYKHCLSPYYMFYYLYENGGEIPYREIRENYQATHSREDIEKIYATAMFNRQNAAICKSKKCDRNCHKCSYDF